MAKKSQTSNVAKSSNENPSWNFRIYSALLQTECGKSKEFIDNEIKDKTSEQSRTSVLKSLLKKNKIVIPSSRNKKVKQSQFSLENIFGTTISKLITSAKEFHELSSNDFSSIAEMQVKDIVKDRKSLDLFSQYSNYLKKKDEYNSNMAKLGEFGICLDWDKIDEQILKDTETSNKSISSSSDNNSPTVN